MATLLPADYEGIATLAERKAAKAQRERIAQRSIAREQQELAVAESFGYESDYASVAGLKARGWTDGLIREFLGKPDKLVDNPHYKCAGAMRLFRVRRVLKVTRSSAWQMRMRQRLFPASILHVWEQIDCDESNTRSFQNFVALDKMPIACTGLAERQVHHEDHKQEAHGEGTMGEKVQTHIAEVWREPVHGPSKQSGMASILPPHFLPDVPETLLHPPGTTWA